jgi:hypothetical protein
MSQIFFEDTIRANVELRAEKMYRQIWKEQPYLRFCKFVNRDVAEKGVVEVSPIGNMLDMKRVAPAKDPINVFEDFSKGDGGTDMMIPVKRTKLGRFTFGDDTLQGKGEGTAFVYQSIRVNEISKAVSVKSGHYSELVYKKYLPDLVGQAQPELTDLFRRYINTAMVKYALFNGKSYELSLPSTSYGRGLTEISHPNMYVPGTGWVSYNALTDTYTNLPGTANYESDVETAINSLANTSAYHFNCALIDKMASLLPQKRILPSVNIGGNDYYVWMISSAQKYQLRRDPDWREVATTVLPREEDPFKNWLLQGCIGAYGGFLFFEDIDAWSAHTNTYPDGYITTPTSGYPTYGPEDTGADNFELISKRDGGPRSCSIILGQQALNVGIAKRISFTEEIWDHQRKKEIGAYMIAGAERPDQFDSDNQLGGGANAFVENTGSAMVVTYSPLVS